MSLIPEFELGLWNAWIFMLPVIILSIFGSKILGRRGEGGFSGHTRKKKKKRESHGMFVVLMDILCRYSL